MGEMNSTATAWHSQRLDVMSEYDNMGCTLVAVYNNATKTASLYFRCDSVWNYHYFSVISFNSIGLLPVISNIDSGETAPTGDLVITRNDTNLNTYSFDTHTHAVATTSVNGFLSSTDKTKLDGISANANNYVHPTNHPGSIITQTFKTKRS